MELRELSVAEAKEMIAKNKKNAHFVVLDVRTLGEYAEVHIPQAVHIDINNDEFEEKIAQLDKNKTYVVHCRSGARSHAASELMLEMGFTDVYNVIGWMFG